MIIIEDLNAAKETVLWISSCINSTTVFLTGYRLLWFFKQNVSSDSHTTKIIKYLIKSSSSKI